MTIQIQGTGIKLTDALKQYVTEKIESLDKFFDHIITADVDIGVRNYHHKKGDIYYAEVNLSVPGNLVRVEKDADDLYKAIDIVKDHLKVELEKIKGKMLDKDRETLHDVKGYNAEM